MQGLSVFLLGKFCLLSGQAEGVKLDSRKAEELLCYLLMNRERAHPREALAELLWGKDDSQQTKNYLRKALWQLQAALENSLDANGQPVLLVEPEWLQVNPRCALWMDVAELETAYKGVKGISGRSLGQEQAQSLEAAAALYRGDLMEGHYQDWCLFERQRLQHQLLTLLEKLMDYCEASRDYESGLAHGVRILYFDRAHERTHTRLMRLHYLSGDRTAALRQYERCQAILHEELNVEPGEATRKLHRQIRQDTLGGEFDRGSQVAALHDSAALHNSAILHELQNHLDHFNEALSQLQTRLQQDIQALERMMRK